MGQDVVAFMDAVGLSSAVLLGRPPFADEVDRRSDPVDATWARESLARFPRFRPVPRVVSARMPKARRRCVSK